MAAGTSTCKHKSEIFFNTHLLTHLTPNQATQLLLLKQEEVICEFADAYNNMKYENLRTLSAIHWVEYKIFLQRLWALPSLTLKKGFRRFSSQSVFALG